MGKCLELNRPDSLAEAHVVEEDDIGGGDRAQYRCRFHQKQNKYQTRMQQERLFHAFGCIVHDCNRCHREKKKPEKKTDEC